MGFLFALCAQNATATDKTRKKNGRIKKIVGALLLNHLVLNAPTTQTNALCPATLPPYANNMMQYIYCAENEETADPFDKYLETQGEEYMNCLSFKSKLLKLYKRVKRLGKCAKEKYTDIVHGAKQRIFGKTPDRNREVEMFQEYLRNLEGVDNVEKLSEMFEGLDKPDFFQLNSLHDLYSRAFPTMINFLTLEHGVLLGMLQHRYKDMNFEQADQLMSFLKNMNARVQFVKQMDEYLDYDLDRNKKVLLALKEFSPDDPDNEKNALEPWIQNKDLSSEKIDETIIYCFKSLKNQRQCWDSKTEDFKKSNL